MSRFVHLVRRATLAVRILRRETSRTLLTDETVLADPFDQFRLWFEEAGRCAGIDQPEAMSIATLDPHGYPDTRMVLLKEYDRTGFVFYTNVNSVKGKSLHSLPRAGLLFYWEALARQVRIQGDVTVEEKAQADAYFATRPRSSQISSWVSDQSQPVKDRESMVRAVADARERFKGKDVPAPPHWAGFRVAPLRFEFWQLRPDRLHDRFLYVKKGNHWERSRLYP